MDVGKFKASRRRLASWILIPPVLAVTAGLSSYAWQQRMEISMQETQSLSDVLPSIIEARRHAVELIENLGVTDESAIASDDQLISFLQEVAVKQDFIVESVQVNRVQKSATQPFPMLRVMVDGSGEFRAIQLFINDIKSSQQLLSVDSVSLTLPRQSQGDGQFSASMVFNLLLIDEVLQSGGAR